MIDDTYRVGDSKSEIVRGIRDLDTGKMIPAVTEFNLITGEYVQLDTNPETGRVQLTEIDGESTILHVSKKGNIKIVRKNDLEEDKEC